MEYCERCNSPLSPAEHLCCMLCQGRLLERFMWPLVHKTLETLLPSEDLSSLKEKTVALFRMRPQPLTDPYPPEASTPQFFWEALKNTSRQWHAFETAIDKYDSTVAGIDPKRAFPVLILNVVSGRRFFRQYLHASRRVGKSRDACWTLVYYDAMFYACLRAFAQACIQGRKVPEILDAAVRAILRIQRSLALLARVGAEEGDETLLLWFTGWIRTGISLKYNRRMRKMLEHEGEDPYAVLLDQLPGVVSMALGECKEKTLNELMSRCRSLVEHDGLALEPQDHFSEEKSLHKMYREIETWGNLATALEEWRTREEARRDINSLCAKAGLSSRMQAALLLKAEGLPRKEIATRMGISEERAKEHLAEGMKRLKGIR